MYISSGTKTNTQNHVQIYQQRCTILSSCKPTLILPKIFLRVATNILHLIQNQTMSLSLEYMQASCLLAVQKNLCTLDKYKIKNNIHSLCFICTESDKDEEHGPFLDTDVLFLGSKPCYQSTIVLEHNILKQYHNSYYVHNTIQQVH